MTIRDKRAKAQWQVARVVEAPVERVWALLLENIPSLRSAMPDLTCRGSGRDFYAADVMTTRGDRVHVEIDQRRPCVAIQGEWWYRGVYSVKPHDQGSRVVYRVSNVAPGASWWAAQLMQGPQHAREMAEQLDTMLTGICGQLSCRFHPD